MSLSTFCLPFGTCQISFFHEHAESEECRRLQILICQSLGPQGQDVPQDIAVYKMYRIQQCSVPTYCEEFIWRLVNYSARLAFYRRSSSSFLVFHPSLCCALKNHVFSIVFLALRRLFRSEQHATHHFPGLAQRQPCAVFAIVFPVPVGRG